MTNMKTRFSKHLQGVEIGDVDLTTGRYLYVKCDLEAMPPFKNEDDSVELGEYVDCSNIVCVDGISDKNLWDELTEKEKRELVNTIETMSYPIIAGMDVETHEETYS